MGRGAEFFKFSQIFPNFEHFNYKYLAENPPKRVGILVYIIALQFVRNYLQNTLERYIGQRRNAPLLVRPGSYTLVLTSFGDCVYNICQISSNAYYRLKNLTPYNSRTQNIYIQYI